MAALQQEPVELVFCRPWQEKNGAALLWICLEYTHKGPPGESFASSVLCRAFQNGTPLAQGLMSGQPFFCAGASWRPLAPEERVRVHLSFLLMEQDSPVTLEIRAFTLFSSPGWHRRFTLLPSACRTPPPPLRQ